MSDFVGQTIRHYHLTDYIGAGGHGAVYKATHTETEQLIALKIMLPQHSEDNELAQRLHQEAEIIRDLRHPHIVPLIETWDEENTIYLAMPWIDGGDLRGYAEEHGKLTPEQLSPILTQICSALDAGHAAQIIHRDIKPENILLDSTGKAYLTDFGIAKRLDNKNAITAMGNVVGTPHYLSPEQIMGAELGNRTDIYALGIMIHEMLNGGHPYAETQSKVQLMMRLVQEVLPPLASDKIKAEHMDDLYGLILRCTSKDPAERYLTASSVAFHFAQIIGV